MEAAAYVQMTAPLVRFRFTGARRDHEGRPVALRHVMAKVSRPEVAAAFMRPPADALLDKLVREGALSRAEAEIARELPISEDICVEADSAGHTDGRSAYALMPAMLSLRDEEMTRHGYAKPIRIGASGGLGTPEAVAAAFVLGAEFVIDGLGQPVLAGGRHVGRGQGDAGRPRRPGHRVRPGGGHVRAGREGAGGQEGHAVPGPRQQALPALPPVRLAGGDRRGDPADDRGEVLRPVASTRSGRRPGTTWPSARRTSWRGRSRTPSTAWR